MKINIFPSTLFVLALFSAACSKNINDVGSMAKPAGAATAQAVLRPQIAPKAPEDWIIVQDEDYIPVIDDLSRKLQSARKAFLIKDATTAAADLRATSDLLSKEAAGTARERKENIDATMKQLSALAADLDGGKPVSAKRFDGVITAAHHADLERDWLVVDESTWYPYVEQPNLQFQNAHQSSLSKDYTKAGQEIHKGAAFVRLEASRASGHVKVSLNASARELDTLAINTEKGTIKDVKLLDGEFARADHALALSHQLKAKDSWAKKEAAKAGYEMKAGALHLEQAADWAGSEAKSGASATVKETRTLAGQLTEGTAYVMEEVGKGIDDLGKAIAQLGKKASPGK